MPRYTLVWTETFVRTARKFLRRHPDLRGLFGDVLAQLEDDPHVPRLRLHRLKGRHRDKHAVSLTYSHRIVLILRIEAGEVVLLDVGSHDDVYRGWVGAQGSAAWDLSATSFVDQAGDDVHSRDRIGANYQRIHEKGQPAEEADEAEAQYGLLRDRDDDQR